MGSSKVVKISDRKVKLVHQLDSDGKAYAEDITIELQDGVEASRLAWLAAKDGKIGTGSYIFTEDSIQREGLQFPE